MILMKAMKKYKAKLIAKKKIELKSKETWSKIGKRPEDVIKVGDSFMKQIKEDELDQER